MTRPGRRVSWDLLRCASVLMVMLYHSTFIGPLVYHQFVARHLVFAHQIGSSLLLALSAYFVAATLVRRGGEGAVARWWWGKIARLFPPFVAATLVAWAALRFLAPAGMFHPGWYNLVTNLAMLWNWNGVRHWDYIDGSYWTIPLQLMAFTVAALIRQTRLGHGRGLRGLMWAGVLLPLAQWPFTAELGPLYTSMVDGFGLYRWHLFVAGLAVWMLSTGRLRRPHAAALLVSCLAAHAIQISGVEADGRFGTDGWAVLGVGLGLLAMVLSAYGPDLAARLPATVIRGVNRVARDSYGVFLVHQTLGYVLMLRLQETFGLGPGLQTMTMILNGVVLGALMARFVERPALHALLAAWDRRATRRKPMTSRPMPDLEPTVRASRLSGSLAA